MAACRCVQESTYWLLLAADEAEQQAVLYCLAAAASTLHYTAVVLVSDTGAEGHAVQQALSAWYARCPATAECDVRLMGSDPDSWQDLLKYKSARLCIRQGVQVLVVPCCQSALALLQDTLVKVDPSQLVLLATPAAVPPAGRDSELQSLPVQLPCSTFIQVCRADWPRHCMHHSEVHLHSLYSLYLTQACRVHVLVEPMCEPHQLQISREAASSLRGPDDAWYVVTMPCVQVTCSPTAASVEANHLSWAVPWRSCMSARHSLNSLQVLPATEGLGAGAGLAKLSAALDAALVLSSCSAANLLHQPQVRLHTIRVAVPVCLPSMPAMQQPRRCAIKAKGLTLTKPCAPCAGPASPQAILGGRRGKLSGSSACA